MDAESHPELGNSHLRMCRAQEIPGGPILRILFTISPDDEFCDLWHVDMTDDPESVDDPDE
jgi:hypothetical protein